jgi:hypothetical protein
VRQPRLLLEYKQNVIVFVRTQREDDVNVTNFPEKSKSSLRDEEVQNLHFNLMELPWVQVEGRHPEEFLHSKILFLLMLVCCSASFTCWGVLCVPSLFICGQYRTSQDSI